MSGLIQAIQAARDGPSDDLAERQAPALAQLKALCERHQHSPFVKLGEFCREMLNDWEAIIRPLLDPSLPLTNNAAERLLRHWVIARRLSFGTRSEQGTRAFALLASIIGRHLSRKEGVRLGLPHRRPSGWLTKDYRCRLCPPSR